MNKASKLLVKADLQKSQVLPAHCTWRRKELWWRLQEKDGKWVRKEMSEEEVVGGTDGAGATQEATPGIQRPGHREDLGRDWLMTR